MDQAEDAVAALTEEIVARVFQELPSADPTFVQAMARENAERHVPILQRGEALQRELLEYARQWGIEHKFKDTVEASMRSERETIVNSVAGIIVGAHRRIVQLGVPGSTAAAMVTDALARGRQPGVWSRLARRRHG